MEQQSYAVPICAPAAVEVRISVQLAIGTKSASNGSLCYEAKSDCCWGMSTSDLDNPALTHGGANAWRAISSLDQWMCKTC